MTPLARLFLAWLFLARLFLAWVPQQESPDAWGTLWSELESLRAGSVSQQDAETLRAHLTEEAVRRGGDGPRSSLLAASLESLAGRDATSAGARLVALQPSPFGPRELWFLADLLPPGEARARTVLGALEEPANLARWQFFVAWNTAVDEARVLRHEQSTLPIQLELHRRYQAEWSAHDLAHTYRVLGRLEDLERVLSAAIASEEAAGRRPVSLWQLRGFSALGFGDECAGRDYLGKALALGSDDAELVLARLDLVAGELESARRGFRAVLFNRPPPAWAWRGWGTTLLPPAFSEPTLLTVPEQ